MHMCMCPYVCTHMCAYVYVCTCACVHVSSACMCLCVHMCVHSEETFGRVRSQLPPGALSQVAGSWLPVLPISGLCKLLVRGNVISASESLKSWNASVQFRQVRSVTVLHAVRGERPVLSGLCVWAVLASLLPRACRCLTRWVSAAYQAPCRVVYRRKRPSGPTQSAVPGPCGLFLGCRPGAWLHVAGDLWAVLPLGQLLAASPWKACRGLFWVPLPVGWAAQPWSLLGSQEGLGRCK